MSEAPDLNPNDEATQRNDQEDCNQDLNFVSSRDEQQQQSRSTTATSQDSVLPDDCNTAGTVQARNGLTTELNNSGEIRSLGNSSAELGSPPPRHGSPGKHGQPSKARQVIRGGPCVECGATHSVLFRKSMDGDPLCNACGLRYQRRLGKHATGRIPGGNYSPATAAAAAAAEAAAAVGLGGSGGSGTGFAVNAGLGSLNSIGSGGLQGVSGYGKRSRKKRGYQGGSEESKPAATRRRLPVEGQRCVYCRATQSPQWRYVGSNLACNACALQQKRRAQRSNSDPKVPRLSFSPVLLFFGCDDFCYVHIDCHMIVTHCGVIIAP